MSPPYQTIFPQLKHKNDKYGNIANVDNLWKTLLHHTSGGSKGGAKDARPPWGSKFFHFHAIFGRKN